MTERSSEPKIVFFSGGTALDGVSRALKRMTKNSVHVLSPFDSGGSTAELRRVFRMPAVGDVRSRLTALSDETIAGVPELCALLSNRFAADCSQKDAVAELQAMASGKHALVAGLPEAVLRRACGLIEAFLGAVPKDFDLSLACVGNLMMTGAYLRQSRSFRSAIATLSDLLHPLGTVVLSAEADRELGAVLADGTVLVGQHKITGRSEPPISSPVADVFLADVEEPSSRASVQADPDVVGMIETADLICYPVGSFYSSLVANLLPRGIGRAIASAECRKVYVPNMGRDPEQNGMTVGKAVEQLVAHVRRDAGEDVAAERILDLVLLDASDAAYSAPLELDRVEALGVPVLRTTICDYMDGPRIDSDRASAALMELTEPESRGRCGRGPLRRSE